MATSEREWFADAPAGFFEWIKKERPEWPALAVANGGYMRVPGFCEAWAVWDAAIFAVMRHIHETPIRELHDKVYALWVGPPMA